MERIHKKSALAETSSLLLGAHDLGVELLWGRHEQQLPLCGFTSNGLNCRKCFQGPCRINPFGDEPSRGVCGADRDQIVMENLFQATLDGVMESARALHGLGSDVAAREVPDFAAGLPSGTKERLLSAGLLPVRKADLFSLHNGFFSHRGYLSQTLNDLARLGLIHYGLLSQATSALDRATDLRAFHSDGVNLFIMGHVPAGLMQALEQQAARREAEKRINLLAQGIHGLPSTTPVADHGSPELALGMNVDALVIAPDASWPAIETLATKYGIPIILVDGAKSFSQTASEAIDQAVRHSQNAFYGTSPRVIRAASSATGEMLQRQQEVKEALQSGRITGVAVLFGEANAKHTFFERTLALMEAAVAEKALVLLGGDLGVHLDLLGAELARRRGDEFAAFSAELEKDGLRPVSAFGSTFEIPRVVALLQALSQTRATGALPAVIAFPEFFRTTTWASAVSLLALGFTVQIGIRLPFWGSPWLAEVMKNEWPAITGGTLLASPALPGPRAQAEELATCLRARRVR